MSLLRKFVQEVAVKMAGKSKISAKTGMNPMDRPPRAATGPAAPAVGPVLQSITITPAEIAMTAGQKQQFTATGVYDDGSTWNLFDKVHWQCLDLDKLAIDQRGRATALRVPGAAEIVATDPATKVSGSTKVTVTAVGDQQQRPGTPVLQSIRIEPANVELAVGAKQQYRATGVYADGSTRDLTTTVAWWCNDLEVISIDENSGLATAQAKTGPAEIAATDGDSDVTGSAKVTVTASAAQPAAPKLQSIRIEPENATLAAGGKQQYRATGVYADGSTRDLTETVGWWCNDLKFIDIDERGLVTAQAVAGTAEIAATDGDTNVTGSTKVTVTAAGAAQPSGKPVLQSIRVEPENVALDFGEQQEFRATGVYSDGRPRDVIVDVDWRSNHPNIVLIDDDGLATAQHKAGTAQISVTDKATNVSGSIEVTVKAPLFVKAKFSRGLNAAERSKAQSVYQDSIDYDKVTLFCGGLGPALAAGRTIGNKIYVRAKFFKEDSTELTSEGIEVLIHELTHVWQFQHGGVAYAFNSLGAQAAGWLTLRPMHAYKWWNAVKKNKPWEKWNAEQQAQAMEHYYEANAKIAAGEKPPEGSQTTYEQIVETLKPYVDQVRAGKGAPGNRGNK